MKTILIIGAGKSSTVLIDYLARKAELNNWRLIVADADASLAKAKIKNAKFSQAVALDVTQDLQREKLIQKAHVVISMMPPALHYLIARDCVEFRKHLLTASYIDEKIRSLKDEIHQRKLLFLCEMGLDPGIDHMSAMSIIDRIRENNGEIISFRSHCGGLVAPENDDNPWRYKISWNPRNVVLAGTAGAEFKENGEHISRKYHELFEGKERVTIEGLDPLAFYPNRDSLAYTKLYQLKDAATFLRTTLRYPPFMQGWNAIVQAGLSNDQIPLSHPLRFEDWSAPIRSFITDQNLVQLSFLGLFEDALIPASCKTGADALQSLLETKLAMRPADKDMVVMLHEFEYEVQTMRKSVQSSLVVEGQDATYTAMAKTVGLPLGIAACLLLNGQLELTGLHIPAQRQIYQPVLKELEEEGICFKEKWT